MLALIVTNNRQRYWYRYLGRDGEELFLVDHEVPVVAEDILQLPGDVYANPAVHQLVREDRVVVWLLLPAAPLLPLFSASAAAGCRRCSRRGRFPPCRSIDVDLTNVQK